MTNLSEKEHRWIVEHAKEYAGQWVALDGDRLLASGKDGNKIFCGCESGWRGTVLVVRLEPDVAQRGEPQGRSWACIGWNLGRDPNDKCLCGPCVEYRHWMKAIRERGLDG